MVACQSCGARLLRSPAYLKRRPRSFCGRRCCSTWIATAKHCGLPLNTKRLSVWTADLAYWVGLLLSDGSISDNGRLSFTSVDRQLASFVQTFICPDGFIRKFRSASGRWTYMWRAQWKPLVSIMARFSIVPRKSLHVRLPLIPHRFMGDFLRGVFEGDGHVERIGRRAIFTTGSEKFALDLKGWFDRHGFKCRHRSEENLHRITLLALSSLRLAKLMYQPGVKGLNRKRIRLRFIDWRKKQCIRCQKPFVAKIARAMVCAYCRPKYGHASRRELQVSGGTSHPRTPTPAAPRPHRRVHPCGSVKEATPPHPHRPTLLHSGLRAVNPIKGLPGAAPGGVGVGGAWP